MKKSAFWTDYQPGFRFASAPVGTRAFFDEVTQQRYALEPHIPEVVQFERWNDATVLEAGCGVGTDGARFAEAGAIYTGLDASPTALELARRRFELYDLPGRFVRGSVTRLPFPDDTFDHVTSHGVIHHIRETDVAIREFARVLKPDGLARVMVYHRRSLNYLFTIMFVRRIMVTLLLVPGAVRAISRLTREPEPVVAGHKELLAQHRLRYLTDRELFLSNNTDGPGNPLSKVYSKSDLRTLLPGNARGVRTDVRYLNVRLYPGGAWLTKTSIGKRLERVAGWHLYIEFKKGQPG